MRLKMAASVDGISALANGRSQWITSAEAREDGHRWRARADAILTGIGTVLADDPRLDVRLPDGGAPVASGKQPTLVVLDSRLRTPCDAALFSADRAVHIFTTVNAPQAAESALRQRGARVHRLPRAGADAGRVDLPAVLAFLVRERLTGTLHVEAGALLSGALLRAGLVDELLLYLAPTLLGGGRGVAALGTLETLAEGVALEWGSVERVGTDLRILARVLPRGKRAEAGAQPG